MSARYKYRFYVDGVLTNPVYQRSASKVYEREQDRVFHRERLNGSIEFLRDDWEAIYHNTLDHTFDLDIQRLSSVGVYESYMTGKFRKTDGRFDKDNRRVKINPEPLDKYTKILAALDKEYDIIKDLDLPVYAVKYRKHPLIQIAFPYHNVLYNRIGPVAFLQDMGTTYTSTELEDFGFVHEDTVRVYIPGSGDMSPDVSGVYEQTAPTQYERTDGVYRISRVETTRWTISEIATGSIKYRGPDGASNMLDRNPFAQDALTVLEKVGDSTVKCAVFPIWQHQRILTDATTVDGNPTIARPADDIGGLSWNYENYIDMSGAGGNPYIDVYPSDEHTVTPTEYGKYSADAIHFADQYFNPSIYPFPLTKANILMQPSWTEYALTEWMDTTYNTQMEEATTTVTVRNAYKLTEVIQKLTAAIDPAISFPQDSTGSQFLFAGTNPITNTAQEVVHFITPKTNITSGDYDEPAKKAPLTFGQVEDLLRYGPKLYWYITSGGMLSIEHIKYFQNGKNYPSPIVSNDLTVQINPQNQLTWSWHTEKWAYKKESLPREYTFKWMDDTSEFFDGFPIEMLSDFVQADNVAENRITAFTADLDFGQVSPDNVSKDGFFILAAELNDDDEYEVVQTTVQNLGFPYPPVVLQNGWWSFYYLHQNFHKYNLPTEDIKLNDETTTATTTKRAREQDLVFPSPIEPDPMRLVNTSLGNAEIERMEVNLTSRAVNIRALLDLDFDNPG